ncbi:MAG: hypothetical protein DHS20C01_26330 [marine bacterium B5-7]|nr:MAG: hypothetical protein DHS20C01_26330 [marine bacterium B5-7]
MTTILFSDHPCCTRGVATEFYKKNLSSAEAVSGLRKLLNEWHHLTTQIGISYWLDAGTLIGANRSESLIPYDDDIDIGILDEDMPALLKLKGSTDILDCNRDWMPVYETVNHVLRISPVWQEIRMEDDPCYWVDGKFVDKMTGLYIDLMVYHQLPQAQITRKFPIGGKLPQYPWEWFFPLQTITFEGKLLSAPRMIDRYLESEYVGGYLEPDHVFVGGRWIKKNIV